jgi:hypothetical protein
MLWWKRELWLIDHGASLFIHHNWDGWDRKSQKVFPQIARHVLLKQATKLKEVDTLFKSLLTFEHLRSIVAMIPDEWLVNETHFASAADNRKAYADFIIDRLEHSEKFVKEAQDAAGLI